jgi:2-polyprenyl-3-methyl-5-hydroxy-6-metoxy-1,4-benzoquinol methylase
MRPLAIQTRYRLKGAKLDRNQWGSPSPESEQAYRDLMQLGWDELRAHKPDYFARLSVSLAHARGRVLEVGCGIGTMTRWLARQPDVSQVYATDAFEQAVEAVQGLDLEGVECRRMSAEDMNIEPGREFDTVMLCELIEHLYADEEAALLKAVRQHLAPGAGYVVSVPIGWLEDPHHVRAFSRRRFARHLRRHYGPVEGVDVSAGYSQVAWGRFRQ